MFLLCVHVSYRSHDKMAKNSIIDDNHYDDRALNDDKLKLH